jgi:glycosyltransferase involved in cell wall biosynthesis
MVIKTTPKDFTRRTRHWRNGFRLRHPSPLAFVQAFVSRYPGRAKVVVITDDTLSDGQILALHKIGDCFVSLARTEGWGLGAFEATRLGNPVVMTGYGGQLDFLDPEFTYLVDHKMVAVNEPTWAENYKPSDDWAEPSLEHAAHLMREVFDKRAFARKRADTYAQLIAKKFSKNAILSNLLCALSKDGFRASRENGTTLCTLTISKY